MENIQGTALNIKLRHLEKWTEQRRRAAAFYDKELKELGQVTIPVQMTYAKHVYHLYVIRCEKRDELAKFLNENGVSTGLHYPVPLHLQECFRDLGYKVGDFSKTEELADSCVSLPIYPGITEEQLGYVCEKIKHFFRTY
jgi:dTDP-4-amino-4,6-dideoxygalactose transaminase